MMMEDSVEPDHEEAVPPIMTPDNSNPDTAMAEALRRRKPRRRLIAVVISIAIVALTLSAAWALSGTKRQEITIVAIVPLTGVSSYLVEVEDAMIMTVEELNSWGGINGMRIRLVVQDCGSTPEVAVERMAEALDRYDPLAVITATRGAAVPMSEIAEEKGTVMISVGATPANLTEGKDWIFRYYISPTGEGETAIETLETLDVSSLGILHLDDAYGNPIAEQTAGDFEAAGGTTETYAFYPTATDFSDAIASVVDNEAVFVVALRHQYQIILQGLDSMGYDGKVICGIEASIPEMWDLPEAQGVLVSAPLMYNPSAPVDRTFMAEFEERYGMPMTHQGAVGSDVLRLIWGLLSDSDVSKDDLRTLLNGGFVNSGMLGVVSSVAGGHNADIPAFGAVIEGGELQYLL